MRSSIVDPGCPVAPLAYDRQRREAHKLSVSNAHLQDIPSCPDARFLTQTQKNPKPDRQSQPSLMGPHLGRLLLQYERNTSGES